MTEFEWTLHPQAAALVDRLVADAVAKSSQLAGFVLALHEQTSTTLQDWLDSVAGPVTPEELTDLGFLPTGRDGLWRHPGAQLAAVIPADHYEFAVRVDDVQAFASCWQAGEVAGSRLSGYRRVQVLAENEVRLLGVERRSWADGRTPRQWDDRQARAAEKAWRLLADRPRTGTDLQAQLAAARQAVELVGPDLAASYFLQLERQYWQSRNAAGAAQGARQDRLGLGWGNNDHHTFRSSRPAFGGLIEFLATLGFQMRERFYAGAEAGWGAQVIEHPGCGGVIFADVDLAPDEVELDFAHAELAPQQELGTVGMWCALHGESLLAAGMHHLEGQFSFTELGTDLAELGHASMRPFSDLEHLRQAFTEAEWWPVERQVLAELVAAGQLSAGRADEIASSGAAGSHLENLARRGGFKGFNQHNVSVTMAVTHPRDYRR